MNLTDVIYKLCQLTSTDDIQWGSSGCSRYKASKNGCSIILCKENRDNWWSYKIIYSATSAASSKEFNIDSVTYENIEKEIIAQERRGKNKEMHTNIRELNNVIEEIVK